MYMEDRMTIENHVPLPWAWYDSASADQKHVRYIHHIYSTTGSHHTYSTSHFKFTRTGHRELFDYRQLNAAPLLQKSTAQICVHQ
jgi:hypothetical protein